MTISEADLSKWLKLWAALETDLTLISKTVRFPSRTDPDPMSFRVKARSLTSGLIRVGGGQENAHIQGGRIRAEGVSAGWGILVDSAAVNLLVESALVETAGFGVTSKPGIKGDPNAKLVGAMFRQLVIRGIGTLGRSGVQLDGNAEAVVCMGNFVSNLHRSDQARVALAFGAAGAADEEDSNFDTNTAAWIGNLVRDITGAVFHAEDSTYALNFSHNTARDVTRGIEIITDAGPFGHLYIGNVITKCTGYFLAASGGTGALFKDTYIGPSVFDGDGVTSTETWGVTLGGVTSSGIHYQGVRHNRFTGHGVRVNMGGPIWITDCAFRNIAGQSLLFTRDDTKAVVSRNSFLGGQTALSGTTTLPGGVRGVKIESNNCFDGTPLVKASSANFIGDKEVLAPVDGSVSSSQIVLLAEQKGWITGVTRVYTTAGGGGSTNGNFSIVRQRSGVSDVVLFTRAISRSGTLMALTLFNSSVSDLTNEILPGDIIRIDCDGAADQSTKAAIKFDWFYYAEVA